LQSFLYITAGGLITLVVVHCLMSTRAACNHKHGRNWGTHERCPRPSKEKKLLYYHVGLHTDQLQFAVFFDIHIVILLKLFIKKVIVRLTEQDDVITPLLRGAPRLGLALGPALAKAGPECLHWLRFVGQESGYFCLSNYAIFRGITTV